MVEVHTPATSADELVVAVAARLHPQVDALTSNLRVRLSDRIPELDGDGPIVDLLHASIEGNLENILYSLRHRIGVEGVEPPSAAYEYARRLAQRGVPVSALVRAYRLAQQHLLELVFDECQAIEAEPDVRADAYQHIIVALFDYIDWISQGVINVYESERERWLTELTSARTGRVEDLIAGRVTDVDAAEKVIGYRLRVPHLAAILWVPETGAQQDQVSRFTRSAAIIAEHVESRRSPLVIPRDRASAWAWFEVEENCRIDGDVLFSSLAAVGGPPVPRVAFGRTQTGVAGFRATHQQALQAQQVAMVRDDPTHAVTCFDEPGLKVAALLVRELDTTRTWVRETLGDLARADEHHERLRRTLLLFFQNDSSYTATADAMLMHKNSVKYRIASAEKALGRSISSDRQAIELALTACHWLHPAVLIRDE
ncbi:hypothetical protein N802_18615 [Knoellia sinensis KCTC 19936]|uniref:PucR family transcriptional regulator n=1 Tax=Knoellia sinensis KCTC 19936 TaxID=1385520 RepID=A0A0A0J6H2_9MICO|nr:helix-turn-helix domain-containing protein [Knoellia sinensis]KGN32379.1 hypothetical protein N802_18615 [Knoellia sinensis KCTC 19936]